MDKDREECLARSQEQSHECGECGQEWDGDGDCPVCNPTVERMKSALKLSNILTADGREKIKELEKVLEKSEERVKMLKEDLSSASKFGTDEANFNLLLKRVLTIEWRLE